LESTTINTAGKPVLLKVRVYAASPCVIHMIGIDPSRPNSTYFNRTNGTKSEPFTGVREFNFPMPISPDTLKFIVKPDNDDCHVEIQDYKLSRLNQQQLWLRPDEQAFLDFAVEFVVKAGTLPQGMYESDDGKFFINYLNDIKDYSSGQSENTPARISRATGYIEINRSKFVGYTIPMRLVMLLHEFMHWRLKSRIELECDFNALNIFLKLGSSKTQALTAFTKVFHDKDHLVERTEKISKFIKEFPDLNPER
jgi:hypothetical protein